MKITVTFFLSMLILFATSCEKCSTCKSATYDGTCTCYQDGEQVSEVTYLDMAALDRQQIQNVCEQQAGCEFTEDVTTETTEPCGYKNEVEDKVSKLETEGWVCSDIE